MMHALTRSLAEGNDLSESQVGQAVQALTDEAVSTEEKADFLIALAKKGETVDELATFARLLRERSIQPVLTPEVRSREILDVVGTGGDKLQTINISSTAALLCAAAGVTVAKHGNRAMTSRSGSADVLEACHIRIDLQPDAVSDALRDQGFSFLFAPHYHPAFKHIGPARKLCASRGSRTIFNFLGPLLNPVRPSAMLVGVSQPGLCEPFARVLQTLGVRRAMVVCGEVPTSDGAAYMDELSTLGDTTVAEFYQDKGLSSSKLSSSMLPVQPATIADLNGGDRDQNATATRRILNGEERGPKRDAVLLTAAAGLFVGGACRSILDGWDLAARVIDQGAAAAKLAALSSH